MIPTTGLTDTTSTGVPLNAVVHCCVNSQRPIKEADVDFIHWPDFLGLYLQEFKDLLSQITLSSVKSIKGFR